MFESVFLWYYYFFFLLYKLDIIIIIFPLNRYQCVSAGLNNGFFFLLLIYFKHKGTNNKNFHIWSYTKAIKILMTKTHAPKWYTHHIIILQQSTTDNIFICIHYFLGKLWTKALAISNVFLFELFMKDYNKIINEMICFFLILKRSFCIDNFI